MIVVDTNVIHYCWVRGQRTEVAQAVRRRDPDWHATILWRSELRSVLTAYLRRELLSRDQIVGIMPLIRRSLEVNTSSPTNSCSTLSWKRADCL